MIQGLKQYLFMFGLDYVPVPKDGNCALMAVLMASKRSRQGNATDAMELRTRAVTYMRVWNSIVLLWSLHCE